MSLHVHFSRFVTTLFPGFSPKGPLKGDEYGMKEPWERGCFVIFNPCQSSHFLTILVSFLFILIVPRSVFQTLLNLARSSCALTIWARRIFLRDYVEVGLVELSLKKTRRFGCINILVSSVDTIWALARFCHVNLHQKKR